MRLARTSMAFDSSKARGELGALGRQILDQDIELAGHAAQGEQALFGLFQAIGLELETLGDRVDGGAGFLGLDQSPVDGLAGGG